jgi:hypothetical protein
VCRRRTTTRAVEEVVDYDETALDAALRQEFPETGWWFDSAPSPRPR